jgi:hypothetical protein
MVNIMFNQAIEPSLMSFSNKKHSNQSNHRNDRQNQNHSSTDDRPPTSAAAAARSQQRAADLVFDGGQIPDESNVKVNKHRDQIEYTKSMPNFLQQMKAQALARRGVTAEQDLERAKEIQKFTMHTVDDKRKHLESYEDPAPPTSAKEAAAAADQAQTDAEFEDEAFQRALREMQQSSKPTQLTKANAAAAGATMGSARPAVKRARTTDEEQSTTTKDKPKATSAQPSKRNTMALSFAVDDDDEDD